MTSIIKSSVAYQRKIKNGLFFVILSCFILMALFPLLHLVIFLISKGLTSFNIDFFIQTPVPIGQKGGGMLHAILGTLFIILMSSLFSIPLGTLFGIFCSEYKHNVLSILLKTVLEMFTGIPSIVIGILVYLLFVLPFRSFSAFAGAFALSLIMIPIIAKSTEEILGLIPKEVRYAGTALGLSKFQIIFQILVKGTLKSLLTGNLMAIARGAGETAPLLFTAFSSNIVSFDPTGPVATLPVQIYQYAQSPIKSWQEQAWTGALVLILFILTLNIFSKFFTKKG